MSTAQDPSQQLTALSERLGELSLPTARRPPPRYHYLMSAPETAQYIQEYKAWLEEDSAIPPTHPPYLDRHRLISDQARRRSDLAAGGVRFFLSVVGFAKHSSTTTLENLTPSQ